MILAKPKPFLGLKVFQWKDPDSGFKYSASSMPQLLSHIRTYREQNDLPPLEFLQDVVTHYNCMLKENLGACEPSKVPLKRGIIQTIRGGISLLENLMYSSFASQEEADKRASTCKDCPLNVFPDKGPFIKWSDTLAENSVGDRKSSLHNELGNCDGCSCPLRAKVFYNGKIQLEPEHEKAMRLANSKCWQLPENYGNNRPKPL